MFLSNPKESFKEQNEDIETTKKIEKLIHYLILLLPFISLKINSMIFITIHLTILLRAVRPTGTTKDKVN